MTQENQANQEQAPESKPSSDEATAGLSELENKLKEALEFKNKYFYLAAEMENMRKRYAREMDQITKFGTEKILTGLVEVVDNFDRTLTALKKDNDEKVKNIVTGIEMVRNQFLHTLAENGLKVVESLGKSFDPNMHEALGQRAAENAKEDEIVEEFEKGYMLNGRLLRAAKVIIAKK
jgi:molecular chaperone GrpE